MRKLTEQQRQVLLACQAAPFDSWRVQRSLYHPFVVRSLERRGLVQPWKPSGFYHGDHQIEATEAGRAAIAAVTHGVPGAFNEQEKNRG